MNNPCINCTEREPACHSRCETGIEYAKTKAIEKERIERNKRLEMNINTYEADSRQRRHRRSK